MDPRDRARDTINSIDYFDTKEAINPERDQIICD